MRQAIRVYNAQQGHGEVMRLWQWIKATTMAGHQLVVEARTSTRSSEQNAKLHALCQDVSKRVEWAGAKRDVETWKRLLTAAWLRARGDQVTIALPALDGMGVDLVPARTSSLTVGECCELIEFICAWMAHQGIEPDQQE
jgi:NinB protein